MKYGFKTIPLNSTNYKLQIPFLIPASFSQMAMNFFEMQDRARAQTRWMVGAFCVAVILTVVAINAMVLYGAVMLHEVPSDEYSGVTAEPLHAEDFLYISMVTTAVVLLVVGGGTLYKTWQLSAGGETVALMMGARPVNPALADRDEQRLLNIVREMALASGVPVPPVYIMDDESSINAFAAGFSTDDAVIAVTRGCLRLLTRDELQGVIAHEFSHVLNGDMRLNLRLMGLLYGLFVIFLVGWMILRNLRFMRLGDNRKEGGGLVIAIIAFSIGLLIIGFVSWFFGQIIKAAVSRQREYLADASAVQFTRYPEGIAGALKKIGGVNDESRGMVAGNAPEISHMFTASPLGSLFGGMMATHPPLLNRIQRLDPKFDGKYPQISVMDYYGGAAVRNPLEKNPEEKAGKGGIPGIGGIGGKQMAIAAAILASLEEPMKQAADDPFSAQALVYAALLDRENREVREKQLRMLKEQTPPAIFAQLQKVMPSVDATDTLKLQPLVELAVPALKQMSPAQYADFRKNVVELIEADHRVEIREYALQAMLFRFLDVHYGKRPQTRASIFTWDDASRQDASLVLSRLAWSGSDNETEVRAAFSQAERVMNLSGLEFLPREACGLKYFDLALRRLDGLSPKLKQQFLEACFACINADGVIVPQEAQLMHAIAAVLGIPTPPMEVEGG